jgi:hypothetical protein
VDLLATLSVVGLCIALAAAGPSFLLYRAELEIADLRRRLGEAEFAGKKTRVWQWPPGPK